MRTIRNPSTDTKIYIHSRTSLIRNPGECKNAFSGIRKEVPRHNKVKIKYLLLNICSHLQYDFKGENVNKIDH
jgi:hypothetical protein